MEKQYKNIGFIFLLFIPMTVLAFYKSYIMRSPDFEGTIDGYIHLHAAVSSLWIGILLSQPLLIRYKQYRTHRLFGKASYFIFPLLLLTFVPLVARTYDGLEPVVNSVFDAALLILLYPLAIINKKNIAVHMRYMIAVTFIFIGPTLARILIHWTDISRFWVEMLTWGSIVVLLAGLLIWDKINRRTYKPYIVALAGFSVYLIVLFIIEY